MHPLLSLQVSLIQQSCKLFVWYHSYNNKESPLHQDTPVLDKMRLKHNVYYKSSAGSVALSLGCVMARGMESIAVISASMWLSWDKVEDS